MARIIRITSNAEGFRRAGMAHPMAATDHKEGVFSKAQLKALRAEPMLMVQVVEESTGQSGQGNPIDEIRKIAIITAMQAMMMADPERTDESMWTKSGRPELDNLRKRLKEAGADVVITGQDRDQIWAEIKPA